MAHAPRNPAPRRGKTRGKVYQMRPVDLQGSTLDSDDDKLTVIPSTSQFQPEQFTRPLSLSPHTADKSSKFTVEKTGDSIKHVSEQLRTLHLRVMAIEEKIDSIHRMMDVIYKSAPSTLSSGPRPSILTVTNWGD